MTRDSFVLDKDAVLDFEFDWSAWLADGETIASKVVTASTGVTADSGTIAAGIVRVWLSNGTIGSRTVACRITTSAGRTDERTIKLVVTDR